jgi:hypothetical protein
MLAKQAAVEKEIRHRIEKLLRASSDVMIHYMWVRPAELAKSQQTVRDCLAGIEQLEQELDFQDSGSHLKGFIGLAKKTGRDALQM